MDFDLEKQWQAFVSAPAVYIIACTLVAGATWWLKSAISSGQISALKDKIDAKEERLKLVQERLERTNDDLRNVQDELHALRNTVAPQIVAEVSTSASTHIGHIITANTETLSTTVRPVKKGSRVTLIERDSKTGAFKSS